VSSKSDEEFHLKATIEVTEKMSAVVQADWMIKRCIETINNQLWRINCIITNTCSTMKVM
jgi:TfoX/Sxy family transcriptional regulator of competence genes